MKPLICPCGVSITSDDPRVWAGWREAHAGHEQRPIAPLAPDCRNGHSRRDYGRRVTRISHRTRLPYETWRCRKCAHPNAPSNDDPRNQHHVRLIGFDPSTFRGERLDAGLTRAELARRIGVNPSTVEDWDAGVRPPNVVAWRAATEVLEEVRGLCIDWRPRSDYPPQELAELRVLELGAEGLI